MVISEAPSAKGGLGLHIGGLFSGLEGTSSDSFYQFFQFISDTFKKNPYYADVIKCGVDKQKNKDKILKQRLPMCVSQFLLDEITAIKPHTIICSGNTAYDEIKSIQKNSNNEILKNADIKLLLHFSGSAQLHLSMDDKKLIWKCQLGKLSPNEIRLSELSFFKNSSI